MMEVLRPVDKVYTTIQQVENAWDCGKEFKLEFSERVVTVADELELRKKSDSMALAVRYGVYLEKFGYL